MRVVVYARVSTAKQGQKGYGLDAQLETVRAFLAGKDAEIIAEPFVEVETGKGFKALERRPRLSAALDLCRKRRATLVIAKLDRLSRNVRFISTIMDSRVEFIACDNPHATRFTMHILAAVAEHEREIIAQRTREGLRAAKAKGKQLGANGATLAIKHKSEARDRLRPVEDRLRALREAGQSHRTLAATLNAEGLPSPGGGQWHATSVRIALARLAEPTAA